MSWINPNGKNRFRVVGLLAAICLALGQIGCTPNGSPSNLPVVSVQIGKKTFNLEVAADHASQETGLMKRDSMPANHGMLFIFPDEQILGFWMKDTRFDLDIVFLNGARKVVSIRQMAAYNRDTVSSLGAAKYAIELNKGAAAESGIRVGDEVSLPPSIQTK